MNEFCSLLQKSSKVAAVNFGEALRAAVSLWCSQGVSVSTVGQAKLGFGLSLEAVFNTSGRNPAALVMSEIWGQIVLNHLPGYSST